MTERRSNIRILTTTGWNVRRGRPSFSNLLGFLPPNLARLLVDALVEGALDRIAVRILEETDVTDLLRHLHGPEAEATCGFRFCSDLVDGFLARKFNADMGERAHGRMSGRRERVVAFIELPEYENERRVGTRRIAQPRVSAVLVFALRKQAQMGELLIPGDAGVDVFHRERDVCPRCAHGTNGVTG